jgi:hypothetical protein
MRFAANGHGVSRKPSDRAAAEEILIRLERERDRLRWAMEEFQYAATLH